MPNWNIFRKIGAIIISGATVFILTVENMFQINTANAYNSDTIPQLKSINIDSEEPYSYIGILQKVMNIDIDDDGKKEVIAYYKDNSLEYPQQVNIDAFYDIYDDCSDTPKTVYSDIYTYHKTHIVQDNNIGKIYIAEIDQYGFSSVYPNKQYGMSSTRDGELYYAYMQNVNFLDEIAYGKGDIDGDADITISDAITMLSYYAKNAAGLPTEINDIQKNAADIDNDSRITISDATTALSIYAEHAAGLIDTLMLPPTAKDSGEPYKVLTGDLESTFYYDIDNDGKKETIGKYINAKDNSSISLPLAQDYIFQVYDNGNFYDTFGYDPSAGMVKFNYVLVNDHNINQIYLASIYSRGSGTYCYAGITKEYPVVGGASKPILYVDYSIDATSGSPITTETIEIGYNSVIRQELLDYIDNLEIISPYGDEAESLSVFKHIFDTYGQ